MKLPQGRLVAQSTDHVANLLQQYSQKFKGSINVYKTGQGLGSYGFILVANGTVLAAAYNMLNITLYQVTAMERIMSLASTRTEIYELTDDEIGLILGEYAPAAIVAADQIQVPGGARPAAERPEAQRPEVLASPAPEAFVTQPAHAMREGYDGLLASFNTLPGVLGSALVADGFPIYQVGEDVDFEHVAAATEDMVRAGKRIATELQLGNAGQIILETPDYKVVIAPISDMFLCVLTQADANLGLVRLSIHNAQKD